MNLMRKGIATLAIASAGIGVPAALAGPASAAPQSRHNGLVNVEVTNLLNHNRTTILKNVPISVAAAVCHVNVNLLTRQLNRHNVAPCPAKSTSVTRGIVKY